MSRIVRAAAAVSSAALFAGCSYGGLADLPLPGSPPVGAHSYVVTAQFGNALTLAKNETVRYNGVVVGRVEGIRRDGWNARVQLRLNSEAAIPANIEAHIGQSSLLGEKFVALQTPAAPTGRLAQGMAIPISATSSGREVEEVLGALAVILNGGGLSQLRTITVELRDAIGSDGAARDFLTQLNTFVTTLDANRDAIIATMTHLSEIGGMVVAEKSEVGQAMDQLTQAVKGLASQREQIDSMLVHLDGFSQVASSVVRQSGTNIVADLKALQPSLAALAAAGDDVPRAVEDILSFPFPDAVLKAVKGDYVNLDVLMDLSPLIIGNNFANTPGLPTLPGLPGSPSIPGLTPPAAAPGPGAPPVPGLTSLLGGLT